MPPTEALRNAVGWLACPHCGGALELDGNTVACARNHGFDVARQGYVNLLGRAAPRHADTAEMLAARDSFLASGHYSPVREALAEATVPGERVIEVGAGTGWYLAGVLDHRPGALGLATDVSVPAARRAARAHPRAAAVVADTWAGLPLADGAVDTVLAVFAPRNPAEFFRVLGPGGQLVVTLPGPDHLLELRQQHGLLGVAEDKLTALAESLADRFRPTGTSTVRQRMRLTDAEATALVAMGPNAFHGPPDRIPAATTTLEVTVASFAKLG